MCYEYISCLLQCNPTGLHRTLHFMEDGEQQQRDTESSNTTCKLEGRETKVLKVLMGFHHNLNHVLITYTLYISELASLN